MSSGVLLFSKKYDIFEASYPRSISKELIINCCTFPLPNGVVNHKSFAENIVYKLKVKDC